MKVIGLNKEGYILTASSSEVANLLGYISVLKTDKKKIEVGDEIQINEIFSTIKRLSEYQDFFFQFSDKAQEFAELATLKMPFIIEMPKEKKEVKE